MTLLILPTVVNVTVAYPKRVLLMLRALPAQIQICASSVEVYFSSQATMNEMDVVRGLR